jgi:hypothetical protein
VFQGRLGAAVSSVARSWGKKQAGGVDLDGVGGAGDGVAQPVGPLAAEEDVAVAPEDEGRDLQAGRGGFDRQQVAGA